MERGENLADSFLRLLRLFAAISSSVGLALISLPPGPAQNFSPAFRVKSNDARASEKNYGNVTRAENRSGY